MKHKRKHRRGKRRDFWRAWHEEQHRLNKEHGGPPITKGRMHAHWREFFHERMGSWPDEHWAFGGRRFNPWHQGRSAFNPFVANLLSKGGGLLPLLVLKLLAEEPRYGNKLMELINERTNGKLVANPGAIYPLMSMLEAQGFVQGAWADPDKRTVRVYEITEPGREELIRMSAVIRPKLAETIEVLENLVIELDINGDEFI